mgnify:CR=1 FL=1
MKENIKYTNKVELRWVVWLEKLPQDIQLMLNFLKKEEEQ